MTTMRLAIAATALLSISGAAAAQSAGDAKCIILSNAFAQQAKEPQAQKLAEASFYFYLGRVGASTSATSLKALLDAQAKTLTDASAGPAMNLCIKELQTRMQLMQSLAPKPPAQPVQPQQKPEGR